MRWGGKGTRSNRIPRRRPWKLPWDKGEAKVPAALVVDPGAAPEPLQSGGESGEHPTPTSAACRPSSSKAPASIHTGEKEAAGPEHMVPLLRSRRRGVVVEPVPDTGPSSDSDERLESITKEWKKRCSRHRGPGTAPIALSGLPVLAPGEEDDLLMELVCAACKGSGNPVIFGKVQVYETGKFLFVCTCDPGTCWEAGRTLSPSTFEAHAGLVPQSEKSWRKHVWVKLMSSSDRFYLVAKVRAFRQLFKRAAAKRFQQGETGVDLVAIVGNADEDSSEEELELPSRFPLLFSDDSDDEEDLE